MIKIQFCIAGHMKKYMDYGPYDVVLPEGATMSDWYTAFDRGYSHKLTATVWNEEKKRFYRPVKVTLNGARKNVEDDCVLQDGDMIKVALILTGG